MNQKQIGCLKKGKCVHQATVAEKREEQSSSFLPARLRARERSRVIWRLIESWRGTLRTKVRSEQLRLQSRNVNSSLPVWYRLRSRSGGQW